MIILWEDEVLKIIMPEDFLECPELYDAGQGVQHIYKGVMGKIDELSAKRGV